jgi:hypothetical protein
MRDDREESSELGELLGALQDGTITDEQMELLDRLLAADAGAREHYLEYMNMCALLGHFQGALADERELGGAMAWHCFRTILRCLHGVRARSESGCWQRQQPR